MDFTWIAITHTSTLLITFVFVLGFLSKQVGLPPLVGFLIAGFILKALDFQMFDGLNALADLGVTLLLFTIGLKLDIKGLSKPHIWAMTSIHTLIIIITFSLIIFAFSMLGLPLFAGIDLTTAALLAFALSFSSTVFAVKVLEEKGEIKSTHGRITIGILIMQDIIAVTFLTVSTGKLPSPWFIAVLLGLIILRPVIMNIIKRAGHGELLVIVGFILAMGGATLFEMVNMKADLGALVVGMILARQERSAEMANALLAFKDLFLIGFFLSIGLTADINLEVVMTALIIVLLIPLKSLLFFTLLTLFRRRARTSFISSLSLSNYSEFGLIVSAVGYTNGWLTGEWLGVTAVALAITLILASPLNVKSHDIYDYLDDFLRRFENAKTAPTASMINTGKAEILVFGMGRVGTNAYDTLRNQFGDVVLGVDSDELVVQRHLQDNRQVIQGDASDSDFWEHLFLDKVQVVMLDMPKAEENMYAFKQLKKIGYKGKAAATAKYDDQIAAMKAAGLDAAFNIYGEAGAGFANHVSEQLYTK